jgi:hypothetical protein
MELRVDIGFDQLIHMVKQLPRKQLEKLLTEVSRLPRPVAKSGDLKSLLLSGPTFSEEQLQDIYKTREALTKWRTK